jgi:hypothetical protein
VIPLVAFFSIAVDVAPAGEVKICVLIGTLNGDPVFIDFVELLPVAINCCCAVDAVALFVERTDTVDITVE